MLTAQNIFEGKATELTGSLSYKRRFRNSDPVQLTLTREGFCRVDNY